MTVQVTTGCTACGACVVTCPPGALTAAPLRPAVDAVRCTDCLACIEVCPADAIVWAPSAPQGVSPSAAARMGA